MTSSSRRARRSRTGRLRRIVIACMGFGFAYLLLSKEKRGARKAVIAAPEQTRRIEGKLGVLELTDGGRSGLAVICLHGLGGLAAQWGEVLGRLRHRRRAVAFDFRGHGASARVVDGAYTLSDLASDVVEVADTLGLERFVLAGHSLGSAVAIEAADRLGERVAGLLLLDPNGDQSRIPTDELSSLRRALAEDAEGELSWHYRQILVGSEVSSRELVLADLARADPVALRAALESSLESSPLPALERFTGPVLNLLSPLNDLPYSLHRLVPDLVTRHLRGGHWLMLDCPEEVADLMDSFAIECERG